MEKIVQPKNEFGGGPLTLARAMAQREHLEMHRESRRFGDRELEIRSLQLALEAKVQENERWQGCVETIMENLDEGIVVSDEQGMVTLLNRQAEVILDRPRSQVLGQFLHQVWNDCGMPTVPFSSYEHRGRVLHGHEILMKDRGSFSLGTVRILCDVTHIVEMEAQVKTRQRVTAVGEMVGRVAHEIRNPLGSIELFASLLGGTTHDDAERHRLAEQISKVVRTLDQLLSNLLVISGPPQLRVQEVSVEELIQETLLMAMPSIRQRAIVIQESIDPWAPTIEADEMMVRQGLLNILLNAIQASPEGGIIKITSRYEPVWCSNGSNPHASASRQGSPILVLTIRDFGSGIAQEDQPRLFDPFFSKRKGGTGLGLAIVQQVMEVHGGWINCESQLGEGTTLQLYFPQGRKIA